MGPVHELLHTLGFVHEHTRPDRDKFISINSDNIEPGKEMNFEKRTQGSSDFFKKGSVDSKNTPYDVFSLLHYGPQVIWLQQLLVSHARTALSGFLSKRRRCLHLPSWPSRWELAGARRRRSALNNWPGANMFIMKKIMSEHLDIFQVELAMAYGCQVSMAFCANLFHNIGKGRFLKTLINIHFSCLHIQWISSAGSSRYAPPIHSLQPAPQHPYA